MSAYLPALVVAAGIGVMSILCYALAWTLDKPTPESREPSTGVHQ